MTDAMRELKYCNKCLQMTNHILIKSSETWQCLKCKDGEDNEREICQCIGVHQRQEG